MKKLNPKGIAHFGLLAIIVLGIAVFGTYRLVASHADSTGCLAGYVKDIYGTCYTTVKPTCPAGTVLHTGGTTTEPRYFCQTVTTTTTAPAPTTTTTTTSSGCPLAGYVKDIYGTCYTTVKPTCPAGTVLHTGGTTTEPRYFCQTVTATTTTTTVAPTTTAACGAAFGSTFYYNGTRCVTLINPTCPTGTTRVTVTDTNTTYYCDKTTLATTTSPATAKKTTAVAVGSASQVIDCTYVKADFSRATEKLTRARCSTLKAHEPDEAKRPVTCHVVGLNGKDHAVSSTSAVCEGLKEEAQEARARFLKSQTTCDYTDSNGKSFLGRIVKDKNECQQITTQSHAAPKAKVTPTPTVYAECKWIDEDGSEQHTTTLSPSDCTHVKRANFANNSSAVPQVHCISRLSIEVGVSTAPICTTPAKTHVAAPAKAHVSAGPGHANTLNENN